MKTPGFLRAIWREKTAEEKIRRALARGDVGFLDQTVSGGADPAALYEVLRGLKNPHPRSLDYLEEWIEALAYIPGDHVPRRHDWRIERKKKR
jgi:hypothetical protein